MNRRIHLLIVAILICVSVFTCSAKNALNRPQGPEVWSPHELKEWLAEHRIYYRGIPEKDELVILVKSNLKEDEILNQRDDKLTYFVDELVKSLKSYAIKGKDLTKENYNALTEEIAKNVEAIRTRVGITEDKMSSVFNTVKARLSGAKDTTNQQIMDILQDISQSYANAKSKRDEIINEASKRIGEDYKKSKKVSDDTVKWLKEQIDRLSESPAFDKSRIQTQTILILRSVEEKLVSTAKIPAKEAEALGTKLSSALGEPYGKTKNIFRRIGNGIYNTVAGTWRAGVYVTRKVVDGKNYVVGRIIDVKNGVVYFFGRVTGRAQKTVVDTKKAQEERLAELSNFVRESVINKPKEPIAKILSNIEDRMLATKKLTEDQAKIVKQTFNEKLGNIKDAKDLTEERVNEVINALREKFGSSSNDKCGEMYEKVTTEKIIKKPEEL